MNCILGWLFSSSEYISITPSDLPNTISGTPVAETSWTPILAIPKEERKRGGERREEREREEREREKGGTERGEKGGGREREEEEEKMREGGKKSGERDK